MGNRKKVKSEESANKKKPFLSKRWNIGTMTFISNTRLKNIVEKKNRNQAK